MGWGPWGMRTARRCKQGEKGRERYPGGFSAIPWNWQKRRCRQVQVQAGAGAGGGGQVQGRMHVARGREGVRRMYRRTCPASCMYRPPYRVPSTWAETQPHRTPEGEYRYHLSVDQFNVQK